MTPDTGPGSHRLITICIPVFNEEGNIDRLLDRLNVVVKHHADYDFEFLFTDNASTDGTFTKLAEKAALDRRIRVLRFSRNFGFQRSILTNLLNARGAAAIQIDADLQDPPELFTDFLAKWETGYKVVYGIRLRRPEYWVLRLARKAHYRAIRAISEVEVPLDAGDFRLVDRVIIEHLRTYVDQTPYLRGIIASLGYPQIGIPYDRMARAAGRSKFNLAKLTALSVDGICSQSTKPLHYITVFGLLTSIVVAIMVLTYLLIFFFSSSDLPPGFTTLALLMLTSIGINAAFVGMIGEYVGRIYNNVRGGPMTVIVDRIEQPRLEQQSDTARERVQ
jgi:dolichol-phosphate mannosyltransferase